MAGDGRESSYKVQTYSESTTFTRSICYIRSLYPHNAVFQHNIPIVDTIQDVAYYRFGYIMKCESSGDFDAKVDEGGWKKVMEVLGFHDEYPVSGAFRAGFSQYIMDMLESTTTVTSSCDLFNPNALIHQPRHWPFSVSLKNLSMDGASPSGFYFLEPHSTEGRPPFLMAVPNSSTVLEIIRREWKCNPRALILELMECGIPFRTFVPGPPGLPHLRRSPTTTQRTRASQLGEREEDHIFDCNEYARYAQLRKEILRSPRGRAAMSVGGIVGRIARNIVVEELVLRGPSENVQETGAFFTDDGQSGYWDDQLTEDEVDAICGVYDIRMKGQFYLFHLTKLMPSSQSDGGRAKKSWWPKPSAWERSGLNCHGYWSGDAEAWFQRRMKMIEDQKAVPLTNADWKNVVKYCYRTARRGFEQNEKLANGVLDRHLGLR
ncbi:hypothetical protein VNI00_011388 [Paramarasmius palmivorus]|uniref:Uncharacterized protein n=1 Tax=Paramarasmius palmivorus TaxID=297713 RepID=A0AAW0CDS4_9AGAR